MPQNTEATNLFEQDRRYGAYVRLMKLLLPLVTITMILLLILVPLFATSESGFTLDFTEIAEFDDTIRMVAPEFSGIDAKERAYVFKAESAYQKTDEEDTIYLDTITADVTLRKGAWLALDSLTGTFHPNAERLELTGQVNIFSDLGYEVHSRRLRLDMQSGTASSEERVFGQGPFGVFEAGGIEVDIDGDYIHLRSGVTVTVYPRASEGTG